VVSPVVVDEVVLARIPRAVNLLKAREIPRVLSKILADVRGFDADLHQCRFLELAQDPVQAKVIVVLSGLKRVNGMVGRKGVSIEFGAYDWIEHGLSTYNIAGRVELIIRNSNLPIIDSQVIEPAKRAPPKKGGQALDGVFLMGLALQANGQPLVQVMVAFRGKVEEPYGHCGPACPAIRQSTRKMLAVFLNGGPNVAPSLESIDRIRRVRHLEHPKCDRL
jgi:hypothetical protein